MGWPKERCGSQRGHAPEATVRTKTSTCVYQTAWTSRSKRTRPCRSASRSSQPAITAKTARATSPRGLLAPVVGPTARLVHLEQPREQTLEPAQTVGIRPVRERPGRVLVDFHEHAVHAGGHSGRAEGVDEMGVASGAVAQTAR